MVEEGWAKPFCLLFCLEVACSGHRLSCRSWAACHVSALLLALLLHQEEQTCKLAALCQVTAFSFCLRVVWIIVPRCERGPGLPSTGHMGYTYTPCQCQRSKQNCFAPANQEVSITLEGATNNVTFGCFLFCVLVLWASKTLFLLMKTETPPAKQRLYRVIWLQSWKSEPCHASQGILIKLATLVAGFEVVEFWDWCVCKWCFTTGKVVTPAALFYSWHSPAKPSAVQKKRCVLLCLAFTRDLALCDLTEVIETAQRKACCLFALTL